jgi:DEAD/DEAH box helicase domain-containing protein
VLLGVEEVAHGEQTTAVASATDMTADESGAAGSERRAPCAQPRPRLVYFDIETLRSADDVGGWNHKERMGMALAVIYDERDEQFVTYHEPQVGELLERLRCADLIVGYNLLGFDYQVLSAYTDEALDRLPTFDIMYALRERLGFRPALASVAAATLGCSKSADGLQSLEWVRQGRFDLVEEYCRQDVALTRDLFRHALQHGTLCFERAGSKLQTPPLGWDLQEIVQNAARGKAARLRGSQKSLFRREPPQPTW